MIVHLSKETNKQSSLQVTVKHHLVGLQRPGCSSILLVWSYHTFHTSHAIFRLTFQTQTYNNADTSYFDGPRQQTNKQTHIRALTLASTLTRAQPRAHTHTHTFSWHFSKSLLRNGFRWRVASTRHHWHGLQILSRR